MANPKANALDKLAENAKLGEKTTSKSSTNTANVNINTTINNFHKNNRNKKASTFKALDFSDVAIYGKGDKKGIASNDAEKFRHFHQMRIFVERGQTIKHGETTGEQTVIVCNLPEQIQYALNSKWGSPIKFGDDGMFNLLMQVGSETIGLDAPSGTLRASTLRIWQNTEPLSLNLQIPVIDDGKDISGTNLVEALEILGSLVLPRRNETFFYTPPPSPLSVDIKYSTLDPRKPSEARNLKLNTRNYARILVQLGGVLLIDNCIIESLSVQYPNTKAQILHDYSTIKNPPNFGSTTTSQYLHPLLAIVNLKISTVEALTANTYSKMLWAKPQEGEGSYSADMSSLTQGIRKATGWIMDIDTDAVDAGKGS